MCGSKVRRERCWRGQPLALDARELRVAARESARIDKSPGPDDVPLPGLEEL